jgi:hypothetical protein
MVFTGKVELVLIKFLSYTETQTLRFAQNVRENTWETLELGMHNKFMITRLVVNVMILFAKEILLIPL